MKSPISAAKQEVASVQEHQVCRKGLVVDRGHSASQAAVHRHRLDANRQAPDLLLLLHWRLRIATLAYELDSAKNERCVKIDYDCMYAPEIWSGCPDELSCNTSNELWK